MNLLDVYFHNKKVGVLKEHNSRLSFKYSDDATEAIAHQLPLQKEAFGDKETRSFFSNLLPEGDVVKKISQIKQVSLNNPFALLRELGGECAGAVSLYPQDMTPVFNDTLEEISEDELASLLSKLSQTPLLTGEGIRLSLAGAQEKLALTIFPDDICTESVITVLNIGYLGMITIICKFLNDIANVFDFWAVPFIIVIFGI